MFKETLVKPEEGLRIFLDTDCSENLLVWYDDGNNMEPTETIREFRLIYNLIDDAHCIIWRKKRIGGKTREIYAHTGVDDGEGRQIIDEDGENIRFLPKQTPVLVLNGVFERKHLLELAEDFLRRAKGVDEKLARFVYEKLLEFPEEQFVSHPHK